MTKREGTTSAFSHVYHWNQKPIRPTFTMSLPQEISFTNSGTETLPSIKERHLKGDPADHEERWSREKIQEAIRVWNLNGIESEQLCSLKGKLADINHYKNNPHDLVRFIRGPQGFDKAEEIFRNMVEWRKEYGTDYLLKEYKPHKILHDYIPSAMLQGVDHDGDPVYVERAGAIDGPGLVRRFDHDDLIKHTVWLRELCDSGAWKEDYMRKHGHAPRNMTIVFDLEGLNSSHVKKEVVPFFKAITSYTADKYYGVSKRMIIIRAPKIFCMVWQIAKNFYKPEVQKKMIFSSKDYLKVLDQYMDRQILPTCINPCGKGMTAQGFPPHLEGGTVPDELGTDETSISNNTQCIYDRNGSASFDSADNAINERPIVSVSCKPILKGSLQQLGGKGYSISVASS